MIVNAASDSRDSWRDVNAAKAITPASPTITAMTPAHNLPATEYRHAG
jgi:hypothetical protein